MAEPPDCRGPDLVDVRNVASHEFEKFGGVAAVRRAPDIHLSPKLISERPSHSVGDEAAFHSKNDMPKQSDTMRGLHAIAYRLSRGSIAIEKPRERCFSFPAVDVERPAWHIADHQLRRKLVTLDAPVLMGLPRQERGFRLFFDSSRERPRRRCVAILLRTVRQTLRAALRVG